MQNEKKIIIFTSLAHYFTHFYELLFPALAIPLVLALDMELTDVLKLSFLMYLLYGVGALPWGFFADRYGSSRSLVIFFIGTGIGSILTSFSNSPATLIFTLAVIGFFSSISHPAGLGLISVGMRNRGSALGINGMAGNLGLVSAPFIAGLLNWLVGWEVTFLLVGIISIICGVVTALVNIDETPIEGIPANRATESTNNSDYIKYFLILCGAMTLAGFAYRMNSIILPAYLEFKAGFLWNYLKGFDLSNLQGAKTMAATLLVSFIYVISTVGQLVAGKLADRYDLRWLYFGFHATSIPFVVSMGIIDQQLLVISASLYVFFALGMQPIENSLVAKYTPNRWRSTSYGIKFILTFGVGSLAVYAVSWIKGTFNLETVYFTCGFIITVLALLVLFLIWSSRGTPCKNNE